MKVEFGEFGCMGSSIERVRQLSSLLGSRRKTSKKPLVEHVVYNFGGGFFW